MQRIPSETNRQGVAEYARLEYLGRGEWLVQYGSEAAWLVMERESRAEPLDDWTRPLEDQVRHTRSVMIRQERDQSAPLPALCTKEGAPMVNARVAELIYVVEVAKHAAFNDSPPLVWHTAAFEMRLEGERARFIMKECFERPIDARSRVEEFLSDWYLFMSLEHGQPEIKLISHTAIMMNEEDKTRHEVSAMLLEGALVFGGEAILVVPGRAYPNPPYAFKVSPDVQTMWDRYEGYRRGREPLPSMAYLCLTVLEASVGGGDNTHAKIAQKYRVDEEVIAKLGYLVSEVGDARTARKLKNPKHRRPHTGMEEQWLDSVIRALIRRAGEWAYNPRLAYPQLTLADFPDLLEDTGLPDNPA